MSKAVNFPSISPSSRSYNPGVFPQTEFAANNGAVSVVRFGNQRVDSELQLVFDNITDSETAEIIENYEAVNSGWDFVQFSSGTASVGVKDDDLRDFSGRQERVCVGATAGHPKSKAHSPTGRQ